MGREGQTRTQKGILGVRAAFKLLEKARVGLRRTHGCIEKDSLVVEEYTYRLKRICYDGWEMHMGARSLNDD